MSHPLLNEWAELGASLRIVGGIRGVGFDTLCRISKLSDERLVLIWDGGDCDVLLEGANFEYHNLSEELLDERRLSEESEWTRQLIIRWPAHPERLCVLFEIREPS